MSVSEEEEEDGGFSSALRERDGQIQHADIQTDPTALCQQAKIRFLLGDVEKLEPIIFISYCSFRLR